MPISATIRARAAVSSCAADGVACARPSINSVGTRKASMTRAGSSDHQTRESLRVGEEVGARAVVGDSSAVQHQRALRHLERELGVLLDQYHGERILANQALQG